ncbi:MAG: hypothetical protein KatS3mg004_2309 [Bryobacteraceae bacterium]|nr:MAG: hypothetical protein KatS3mg004_2309 [Bryobacteraceae bacterium]
MPRAKCCLCESRPPRRACPALGRDICAVCCGSQREETIDCPLDCPHLVEARQHEKIPEPDPATLPHADVEISSHWLREHDSLVLLAGHFLLLAATEAPGAVDSDLRDALEALTRTYRTSASGLIYETRPSNLIAAAIADRFRKEMEAARERAAQKTGVHAIRDQDVFGALVFWQRMAWQTNNRRRRGKAFLTSLFSLLPARTARQPNPLII